MTFEFKKAVKHESKGRVALVGPAGSGKSMTMLKLARKLAGPNGRIAAVDTEHGSLSKYADLFDFDVLPLESYSPDNFMGALKAAVRAKYDVFCTDSLSHFWVGKDGALEFVDLASKRQRDQMGGWKEFRPHERAMVDEMIAAPLHVIVTMRTKTEYVEEINPNTGKKMRRKVGLQPVQRDGLEYEFDLVAYMDDENNLIADKTRCSDYQGKVLPKPSEKDFEPFAEWLKGAPVVQKAVGHPKEQQANQQVPTAQPVETPKPTPPKPIVSSELLQRIKSAKAQFAKAFGADGDAKFAEVLRYNAINPADDMSTDDKLDKVLVQISTDEAAAKISANLAGAFKQMRDSKGAAA